VAEWAMRERKGERRGKKKGRKRGLGRAKRMEDRGRREKKRNVFEIRRYKQIHLNLNLKFKFNRKTSNKIMQCGMKCTR
jgi:hypothetical protein